MVPCFTGAFSVYTSFNVSVDTRLARRTVWRKVRLAHALTDTAKCLVKNATNSLFETDPTSHAAPARPQRCNTPSLMVGGGMMASASGMPALAQEGGWFIRNTVGLSWSDWKSGGNHFNIVCSCSNLLA